ncbi:DUF4315 family protein [Faecalibaculum rodentium]|uniref:DUF4315 family protein n=1 Tax=Faecalibaculum rodentium TaxID=1702221 RepID=UPI00273155B7|nr:DUF4315 family protein [Faecalibaculum rodentium]
MNTKINKLRGELTKNKNKISELQSRNREIERQITELENNDILELVHSHNLDITQLSALIQAMKTDPAAVMRGEMEESEHEEM